MDCRAVACAVGLDGHPTAWVAAGRPAAEELRAVASARDWLHASHGLCPTCYAAR